MVSHVMLTARCRYGGAHTETRTDREARKRAPSGSAGMAAQYMPRLARVRRVFERRVLSSAIQ